MKKSFDIKPTILIIFGISGDLSRQKLLPALYQLEKDKYLPEQFYIFGTSRRDLTSAADIKTISAKIKADDKAALKRLMSRIKTVKFDVTKTEDYPRLRSALESFESSKGICFNVLQYLSIPPDLVPSVVDELASGKLNRACSKESDCRLLLEKPFGTDLGKAKALVKTLQKNFKEQQIYRIDHYLAKETVQNILTVRADNPWLKDLWSAQHIKSIDITAFETVGAEERVTFYEQTGALRDMIQSHLLQLLAVTTMKLPSHLDDKTIPQARLKLLKSVRPLRIHRSRKALRAQYASYRKETENKESNIETFASIPITIDQALWRNTRIRLITGKAMDKRESRISIVFSDFAGSNPQQNILTFRLQPEESIGFTVAVRKTGTADKPEMITLNYSSPDKARLPDAYESVLYSALIGDRTLFPSSEEILTCWKIINPLLKKWSRSPKGLATYKNRAKPAEVLEEAKTKS